jgi:hypothetical protein
MMALRIEISFAWMFKRSRCPEFLLSPSSSPLGQAERWRPAEPEAVLVAAQQLQAVRRPLAVQQRRVPELLATVAERSPLARWLLSQTPPVPLQQ